MVQSLHLLTLLHAYAKIRRGEFDWMDPVEEFLVKIPQAQNTFASVNQRFIR